MIFRLLALIVFRRGVAASAPLNSLIATFVFLFYNSFSKNTAYTYHEMRNFPHWIELRPREKPNILRFSRVKTFFLSTLKSQSIVSRSMKDGCGGIITTDYEPCRGNDCPGFNFRSETRDY